MENTQLENIQNKKIVIHKIKMYISMNYYYNDIFRLNNF